MPAETTSKSASQESMRQLPPEDVLFGNSKNMAEVRSRAEKICKTDVSVLVSGEGGTGKEVLARWIHSRSNYSNGEFVKVNCAAVPGTLLES